MSREHWGGDFTFALNDAAVEVEHLANQDHTQFKPETRERFRRAVAIMSLAYSVCDELNLLLSYDNGDESFQGNFDKVMREDHAAIMDAMKGYEPCPTDPN